MKYTAVKYFSLFSVICTEIFAGISLEKQSELAGNLFRVGKYFDSITEYKRLLFFDYDRQYQFEGNYFIGASYKKGAYFENAIKYFSIAENTSNDIDDVFNTKIEIIRCNLLRGTIPQAILLLNHLEANVSFKTKEKEISYWKGWAFLLNGDWKRAANQFGTVSQEHPLRKLANEVSEESYSPGFARTISYILPGSGQIYSGEILSGLMSLAWNSLFIYLGVKSFQADRILDGFIYTGLFFRFHRGNIENAEKFAQEKNVEITRKALLHIQSSYDGEKP